MENRRLPKQKGGEEAQGLPLWVATFSDMVTLLLTFFVLLLSFAKTESSKYEAALGSIRNAFGGNVLKHGKVIQRGKSPDDSPSMLESENIIKPFPIEFLSTEGLLEKLEINRESDENLDQMREDLNAFDLTDSVNIYQMPEGIKVKVKEKIYFQEGSVLPRDNGVAISVYERLINLMKNRNWVLIVEGYSGRGEVYTDKHGDTHDAFALSSLRAQAVARSLVTRGVSPTKLTTAFYGDTRPSKTSNQQQKDESQNRRVEFIIRKRDLGTPGQKVLSQ